jgi:DNA-binding NarL/FixJ family response regulator
MPIRILIVEDDETTVELIQENLRAESDFEVVGTIGNGRDASSSVKELKPHVVLMDLSLPGLNGLQATKLIRKESPSTAVVILSNYELDDLRERIRESPELLQSSAFVSKREISSRLCGVIRSLAQEESLR